jgi:hypothetical protein
LPHRIVNRQITALGIGVGVCWQARKGEKENKAADEKGDKTRKRATPIHPTLSTRSCPRFAPPLISCLPNRHYREILISCLPLPLCHGNRQPALGHRPKEESEPTESNSRVRQRALSSPIVTLVRDYRRASWKMVAKRQKKDGLLVQ